jgi:hypothetical protein
MRIIGIVLLLVGALTVLVLRFTPIDGDLVWIGRLAPPLGIVLGAFLLYRGKQYGARASALRLLDDERPPVVYLRPFAKDESLAGQVFTAVLTPRMLSGFASEEEQLAQAVAPIGPLVAIGQPGERLPKPGAVRAYATDAEWKGVVQHWLASARLIILRPGTTQGVWWEMERAISMARPERFLLFLVRATRAEYESLAGSLRDRFTLSLPPFDAIQRGRQISGFFQFDDDWRASFLPLKAPFWRVSSYKPTRTLVHNALHPVFQTLGVAWQPSPISSAKIAAIGLLALPVAFFIAVGVVMLMAFLEPSERTYVSPTETRESLAPTTGTSDGSAATPAAPAAAAPAPLWTSWSVVGLQIPVPGFDAPERVQTPMNPPPGSEQAIDAFEGYQITSQSALVIAQRISYKPGIQPSLAGAVQGSLNAMTAEPGITNLKTSSSRVMMFGQPAARTLVQFTIEGVRQRLEALIFVKGHTMWQVNAVVPDSDAAPETLERILGSVTLQ